MYMTFRMHGTNPPSKSVVPRCGFHHTGYAEVFPIWWAISMPKNYCQHFFSCFHFICYDCNGHNSH